MSSKSPLERFRQEVLPISDRLFRLAFSVTLNREEAEDVVQDVMLKLWERQSQWDTLGNMEAWCITATRNTAIDRTRKHRELAIAESDENRQSGTNPHDDMVAAEGEENVMRLLSALPEVQRSIFTLREAEGKTYAEIAATLGISDGQARTYLMRARNKLRELFLHIS